MAMRAFILSALVAAAAARTPVLLKPEDLAVTADLVDKINNHKEHKASFVAGESEFFKGVTAKEARTLLGTKLEGSLPAKTYEHVPDADVPDTFDARVKWPKFVHPIRNQLMCGSCWAFAASEALSDRFTIASNGTVDVVLSPEDMVSCDKTDMGCQGGMLQNAWQYLSTTGIVSDACFPYTAGTGNAPACETKCVDGEKFTKYKSADAFQLKTELDIQKAIMTDGPVEGGFTVYKSFMAYVSGVYKHHWWMFWDTVEGGHAIKIMGWGVENGEKYWLVANSWGTSWGMSGTFKIARGINECQIESQVFAGHAAL